MEGTTLKELIDCAMKTGTMDFRKNQKGTGTVAMVGQHEFHIVDCGLESMTDTQVIVRILNEESFRERIAVKAEASLLDGLSQDAEYDEIVEILEKAYIKPDDELHLCVGFYANGDFKANTVIGKNLADNIEYNLHMRPGRAYFVDGEWVCGGMLKEPYKTEFIELCKARMAELGLEPKPYNTAPYE